MGPTQQPPAADPQHGTRSGYRAHRRAGEEPCQQCQDAYTEISSTYDKARKRAAGRLVKAHRAEYLRYIAEERELQDASAGDAR